MPDKFFEELKEKVKIILGENGSHDFNHTMRVCNNAILISKELNVDLDVVKTAAILHDIAKHKEKKEGIKDHAAHGATEARKILEKTNFPKEKIEIVCKCIVLHNKKEELPAVKEVRILQEADGLDAIGAIGIAREFSYEGEQNAWNSSSQHNPITELIKFSNVDYFKISSAKKLAQEKVKITKDFCNNFIKEFNIKYNN